MKCSGGGTQSLTRNHSTNYVVDHAGHPSRIMPSGRIMLSGVAALGARPERIHVPSGLSSRRLVLGTERPGRICARPQGGYRPAFIQQYELARGSATFRNAEAVALSLRFALTHKVRAHSKPTLIGSSPVHDPSSVIVRRFLRRDPPAGNPVHGPLSPSFNPDYGS